jgi:hypothetical protein
MSGDLTGMECIPYYYGQSVRVVPAFYHVPTTSQQHIKIVPCLMTKIIKHFRKEKDFNFNIFLLPPAVCTAMSWLPIVAQLGLVVLYLTIPQISSHSGFQKTRNEYYKEFFYGRRQKMVTTPHFSELYIKIKYISEMFHAVQIASTANTSITQFVTRKPILALKDEDEAFAVFLTEIVMASEGWELICAEWGIHRNVYSNFMQNLDLLVDVCTSDPYLPILEAQKRLFEHIDAAALLPNAKHVLTALSSLSNAKYSFGCEQTDIVCGIKMTGIRVGYTPYTTPSYPVDDVVLENKLLILLVTAANHVKSFFALTEEHTFQMSRQMSVNLETRKLPTTCIPVSLHVEGSTASILRPLTFDQYHRVLIVDKVDQDVHGGELVEMSRRKQSLV